MQCPVLNNLLSPYYCISLYFYFNFLVIICLIKKKNIQIKNNITNPEKNNFVFFFKKKKGKMTEVAKKDEEQEEQEQEENMQKINNGQESELDENKSSISFEEQREIKERKRKKVYLCSKCGLPKGGHDCLFPEEKPAPKRKKLVRLQGGIGSNNRVSSLSSNSNSNNNNDDNSSNNNNKGISQAAIRTSCNNDKNDNKVPIKMGTSNMSLPQAWLSQGISELIEKQRQEIKLLQEQINAHNCEKKATAILTQEEKMWKNILCTLLHTLQPQGETILNAVLSNNNSFVEPENFNWNEFKILVTQSITEAITTLIDSASKRKHHRLQCKPCGLYASEFCVLLPCTHITCIGCCKTSNCPVCSEPYVDRKYILNK